jgi:hypothetical protein
VKEKEKVNEKEKEKERSEDGNKKVWTCMKTAAWKHPNI